MLSLAARHSRALTQHFGSSLIKQAYIHGCQLPKWHGPEAHIHHRHVLVSPSV